MIENNQLSELAKDVLNNCDIVEVISSRIKVIKTGRGYKALCPFHDDKNPSLMISQDKQIFKCFVCGKSGNAISFIQSYDKISYREAIKEVAKICGYSDKRLDDNFLLSSRKINSELLDVYKCLTLIDQFYEVTLFQSELGKKGLKYLEDRGLNKEVINKFHIGYSSDDGENVIKFLQSKDISIKTIEKAGIGRINSETMKIRDNNAGRVIFPILSKDNQVLGFSARRITNDENVSKYVNTENTIAFNKGNILYNLNNAKEESKTSKHIYIMEGFMDVIALYRIGEGSAVALMGTALTKDHIREIKNLKCEIRLCLDLDSAGQKNTLSIISKLEEEGLECRVVNNIVNFKEKDSDEILHNLGPDKLKSFINNLIDSGEWLINYYSKELNLNSNQDKKKLIQILTPYMLKLKSQFDVELYINKLSSITGLSIKTLNNYYLATKKQKNGEKVNFDNIDLEPKKVERTKLDNCQRKILKYMTLYKEAIEIAKEIEIYMPEQKYRSVVKVLYEYINNIDIGNEIKADELNNFIELNNNIEKKDAIIQCINEILLDETINVPAYTKEEFLHYCKSLDEETKKAQTKQKLSEARKSNIGTEKRSRVIQTIVESERNNK